MLDEARVARERVLADLGRRRSLLQAQVEELRQGRDRLLEAYRVVKRTFLDATEALAHVEARAASQRAHAVDSGEHVALRDDSRPRAREQPSRSREARVLEVVLPDGRPRATDAKRRATRAGRPRRRRPSWPTSTRCSRASGPATPTPRRRPMPTRSCPGRAEAARRRRPPSGRERVGRGRRESSRSSRSSCSRRAAPDAPALPTTPNRTRPTRCRRRRRRRNPRLGPTPGGPGTSPAVDPLVAAVGEAGQAGRPGRPERLLDAVRRHKGRPSAGQVLRDDDGAGDRVERRAAQRARRGVRRRARGRRRGRRTPRPMKSSREAAETIAFPLRDRIAARDRRRRRAATPVGSSSASVPATASGRTSNSNARSAT